MASDEKMVHAMKLDIEKLKEATFSHSQALVVTGLTNDILQAWYKRGLLSNTAPESNREKLRGHRRRYSVVDLLHIAIMAEFAGCGMTLSIAACNAVASLPFLIQLWEHRVTFGRAGIETPNVFFVTFEVSGSVHVEIFSAKAFPTASGGPVTLEEFIRCLGSLRTSLIDGNRFLERFQQRLAAARDLEK